MKQTKKLSFVLVFVILAILTAAVMPVFADNTKTEAINEAKASFSDLYEEINPSVVYIYVGKEADTPSTNYEMDEFDFGDIFEHVHIWGSITGSGMIQADIIPFALKIGLVPSLYIVVPVIIEVTVGTMILVRKLRGK